MSRAAYSKFSKEVKLKLSHIIINFNFIELSLREILSDYIKSSRIDFTNNILLHNSIVPFATKLSILKYIINKEGIKFKDWEKFHKLINIRNAVAHSDNLLNFDGDLVGEELIDDEYDIKIPIYEPYLDGPKITIIKDGKVNEKGLDKMYLEFNEHIGDIEKGLENIKLEIARL